MASRHEIVLKPQFTEQYRRYMGYDVRAKQALDQDISLFQQDGLNYLKSQTGFGAPAPDDTYLLKNPMFNTWDIFNPFFHYASFTMTPQLNLIIDGHPKFKVKVKPDNLNPEGGIFDYGYLTIHNRKLGYYAFDQKQGREVCTLSSLSDTVGYNKWINTVNKRFLNEIAIETYPYIDPETTIPTKYQAGILSQMALNNVTSEEMRKFESTGQFFEVAEYNGIKTIQDAVTTYIHGASLTKFMRCIQVPYKDEGIVGNVEVMHYVPVTQPIQYKDILISTIEKASAKRPILTMVSPYTGHTYKYEEGDDFGELARNATSSLSNELQIHIPTTIYPMEAGNETEYALVNALFPHPSKLKVINPDNFPAFNDLKLPPDAKRYPLSAAKYDELWHAVTQLPEYQAIEDRWKLFYQKGSGRSSITWWFGAPYGQGNHYLRHVEDGTDLRFTNIGDTLGLEDIRSIYSYWKTPKEWQKEEERLTRLKNKSEMAFAVKPDRIKAIVYGDHPVSLDDFTPYPKTEQFVPVNRMAVPLYTRSPTDVTINQYGAKAIPPHHEPSYIDPAGVTAPTRSHTEKSKQVAQAKWLNDRLAKSSQIPYLIDHHESGDIFGLVCTIDTEDKMYYVSPGRPNEAVKLLRRKTYNERNKLPLPWGTLTAIDYWVHQETGQPYHQYNVRPISMSTVDAKNGVMNMKEINASVLGNRVLDLTGIGWFDRYYNFPTMDEAINRGINPETEGVRRHNQSAYFAVACRLGEFVYAYIYDEPWEAIRYVPCNGNPFSQVTQLYDRYASNLTSPPSLFNEGSKLPLNRGLSKNIYYHSGNALRPIGGVFAEEQGNTFNHFDVRTTSITSAMPDPIDASRPVKMIERLWLPYDYVVENNYRIPNAMMKTMLDRLDNPANIGPCVVVNDTKFPLIPIMTPYGVMNFWVTPKHNEFARYKSWTTNEVQVMPLRTKRGAIDFYPGYYERQLIPHLFYLPVPSGMGKAISFKNPTDEHFDHFCFLSSIADTVNFAHTFDIFSYNDYCTKPLNPDGSFFEYRLRNEDNASQVDQMYVTRQVVFDQTCWYRAAFRCGYYDTTPFPLGRIFEELMEQENKTWKNMNLHGSNLPMYDPQRHREFFQTSPFFKWNFVEDWLLNKDKVTDDERKIVWLSVVFGIDYKPIYKLFSLEKNIGTVEWFKAFFLRFLQDGAADKYFNTVSIDFTETTVDNGHLFLEKLKYDEYPKEKATYERPYHRLPQYRFVYEKRPSNDGNITDLYDTFKTGGLTLTFLGNTYPLSSERDRYNLVYQGRLLGENEGRRLLYEKPLMYYGELSVELNEDVVRDTDPSNYRQRFPHKATSGVRIKDIWRYYLSKFPVVFLIDYPCKHPLDAYILSVYYAKVSDSDMIFSQAEVTRVKDTLNPHSETFYQKYPPSPDGIRKLLEDIDAMLIPTEVNRIAWPYLVRDYPKLAAYQADIFYLFGKYLDKDLLIALHECILDAERRYAILSPLWNNNRNYVRPLHFIKDVWMDKMAGWHVVNSNKRHASFSYGAYVIPGNDAIYPIITDWDRHYRDNGDPANNYPNYRYDRPGFGGMTDIGHYLIEKNSPDLYTCLHYHFEGMTLLGLSIYDLMEELISPDSVWSMIKQQYQWIGKYKDFRAWHSLDYNNQPHFWIKWMLINCALFNKFKQAGNPPEMYDSMQYEITRLVDKHITMDAHDYIGIYDFQGWNDNDTVVSKQRGYEKSTSRFHYRYAGNAEYQQRVPGQITAIDRYDHRWSPETKLTKKQDKQLYWVTPKHFYTTNYKRVAEEAFDDQEIPFNSYVSDLALYLSNKQPEVNVSPLSDGVDLITTSGVYAWQMSWLKKSPMYIASTLEHQGFTQGDHVYYPNVIYGDPELDDDRLRMGDKPHHPLYPLMNLRISRAQRSYGIKREDPSSAQRAILGWDNNYVGIITPGGLANEFIEELLLQPQRSDIPSHLGEYGRYGIEVWFENTPWHKYHVDNYTPVYRGSDRRNNDFFTMSSLRPYIRLYGDEGLSVPAGSLDVNIATAFVSNNPTGLRTLAGAFLPADKRFTDTKVQTQYERFVDNPLETFKVIRLNEAGITPMFPPVVKGEYKLIENDNGVQRSGSVFAWNHLRRLDSYDKRGYGTDLMDAFISDWYDASAPVQDPDNIHVARRPHAIRTTTRFLGSGDKTAYIDWMPSHFDITVVNAIMMKYNFQYVNNPKIFNYLPEADKVTMRNAFPTQLLDKIFKLGYNPTVGHIPSHDERSALEGWAIRAGIQGIVSYYNTLMFSDRDAAGQREFNRFAFGSLVYNLMKQQEFEFGFDNAATPYRWVESAFIDVIYEEACKLTDIYAAWHPIECSTNEKLHDFLLQRIGHFRRIFVHYARLLMPREYRALVAKTTGRSDPSYRTTAKVRMYLEDNFREVTLKNEAAMTKSEYQAMIREWRDILETRIWFDQHALFGIWSGGYGSNYHIAVVPLEYHDEIVKSIKTHHEEDYTVSDPGYDNALYDVDYKKHRYSQAWFSSIIEDDRTDLNASFPNKPNQRYLLPMYVGAESLDGYFRVYFYTEDVTQYAFWSAIASPANVKVTDKQETNPARAYNIVFKSNIPKL